VAFAVAHFRQTCKLHLAILVPSSENKLLLFAYHKAADNGSGSGQLSQDLGPATTEGTAAFGFQWKRAAVLATRARTLTTVYHSVGDGISAWQAAASPNSPPKFASIRSRAECSTQSSTLEPQKRNVFAPSVF